MFSKIFALASLSGAAAWDPFVLPGAIQHAQQASLPNIVTVDFQAPRSFLAKKDSQYQTAVESACAAMDQHLSQQNNFMNEVSPSTSVMATVVDAHANKFNLDADMTQMLTKDVANCASETMQSFLGVHGDEVPRPTPVLSILIPVRQDTRMGDSKAVLSEIRALGAWVHKDAVRLGVGPHDIRRWVKTNLNGLKIMITAVKDSFWIVWLSAPY